MSDQYGKASRIITSLDKVIPVVENRIQLAAILKRSTSNVVMLRYCNLLELAPLMLQAQQRGYTVYVNMDHVAGVHPDAVGLRYLAEHVRISGVESTNPKVLSMVHALGLQTILHVYVADSTGLESALETADLNCIDLLDVSPALAIPHIKPALRTILPLPFIGSGLISNVQQMNAVLHAGATAVLMPETDFSA